MSRTKRSRRGEEKWGKKKSMDEVVEGETTPGQLYFQENFEDGKHRGQGPCII
ncbi:MAG: hypothetical protein WBI82_04230 [Sphaerochaeta sp.]